MTALMAALYSLILSSTPLNSVLSGRSASSVSFSSDTIDCQGATRARGRQTHASTNVNDTVAGHSSASTHVIALRVLVPPLVQLLLHDRQILIHVLLETEYVRRRRGREDAEHTHTMDRPSGSVLRHTFWMPSRSFSRSISEKAVRTCAR